MLKLSRNATGQIVNEKTPGQFEPIVLRGGHFNLFDKNRTGRRAIAKEGHTDPLIVRRGDEPPCIVELESCRPLPPSGGERRAVSLPWLPERGWEQLFGVLGETGCNLLRLWVSGGTLFHPLPPDSDDNPFDEFPFRAVKRGGVWKWRVYDAVENNMWNGDFFNRLGNFAAAADRHNVCLQVGLFNYFDLTQDEPDATVFKKWDQSYWNPEVSAGDRMWGETNLVHPRHNAGGDRQAYFITPPANSGLRRVQKKLVAKIVTTLKEKNVGNIIFEIMNEPRQTTPEAVAGFCRDIIEEIDRAAGGWRPLISVNASRPDNTKLYTDWWREHSRPTAPGYVALFDRVDIISFHSLTGYNEYGGVTGCNGRSFKVPPVDRQKIQDRIDKHKGDQAGPRQDKKALMFSTDAAIIRGLTHNYCDVEHPGDLLDMHVRDGQIETDLTRDNVKDSDAERAFKSDLQDWAFWCFERGLGDDLGLIHFQNHSEFEMAFRRIGDAWREVHGG